MEGRGGGFKTLPGVPQPPFSSTGDRSAGPCGPRGLRGGRPVRAVETSIDASAGRVSAPAAASGRLDRGTKIGSGIGVICGGGALLTAAPSSTRLELKGDHPGTLGCSPTLLPLAHEVAVHEDGLGDRRNGKDDQYDAKHGPAFPRFHSGLSNHVQGMPFLDPDHPSALWQHGGAIVFSLGVPPRS